jgi:hypothetical protein
MIKPSIQKKQVQNGDYGVEVIPKVKQGSKVAKEYKINGRVSESLKVR